MDASETDPYEQQLRTLFESFDSHNIGSLDQKGLQQLCEQLPLDAEQSADLIGALIQDKSARISFSRFWEELLTLLGGGWSASCVQASSVEKTKTKQVTLDRGKSPEREVSPKLVLGQKKYGRRSRPESSELEYDSARGDHALNETEKEERLQTLDSADCDTDDDEKNDSSCHNPKKRRTSQSESNPFSDLPRTSIQGLNVTGSYSSLSQAEHCLKLAWHQFGKHGYVDQIELGKVCECVGIEKLSNEAMQQLFEQLDSDEDGKVSLDDFLLLFRAGIPTTPVAPYLSQSSWVAGTSTISGGAILSLSDSNGVGMASVDAIVEMWENVGVSSPSFLLRDLNFDDSLQPLNISSVACALEEEIVRQAKSGLVSDNSTLPNMRGTSNYMNNLLLAALSLRQAEIRWVRSSIDQMSCERDKLRNDLAEANCRASLLAQEIDDHHSKLEKVSQNQFKVLEQKHSEAMRDLTTRFSQEREQLSQHNIRLEQKVGVLQQSESKLAADIASLRIENEMLDHESRNLSERIAECEETKRHMGRELQEMGNLQQRLNELQANQEQDRVEHLYEQINKLREENSILRDRNDELTVELEVLTTRLSSMRVRRQASSTIDGNITGGTKRRGNSPLGVPPSEDSGEEESPRVGKVRRCSQKGEVSLDNVHIEGLQIHPLVSNEPDLDVDDTEDLSSGCFGKLGNKLRARNSKWMNPSSETSSLAGSQDDLMNLSSNTPNSPQIIDVARLQARIEELEHALRLQTCNFVGSHDDKQPDSQGLREVEAGAVYLSEEDTPTSSIAAFSAGVSGTVSCDDNLSETKIDLVKTLQDVTKTNGPAVEELQQHCRDLEIQLDNVKIQIVKILSEKRACSQENCVLKKRISDLRNQLPDSGTDFNSASENTSKNDLSSVHVAEEIESSEPNFSLKVDKRDCPSSDGSITFESALQTKEATNSSDNELRVVRDRCRDLENSLAMMRDEYERCEDYWAGKLDEERHLAEQEQQITDEKFSELMSKIREYEELFADDHLRRSSKPIDGRLETIEEQDGLEKQVTELEEELEDFRCQAEAVLTEKDNEIQSLKEQLQLLQHCHVSQIVCSSDIAVQVSDLDTGSWGSDRTFIVKPRIVNENLSEGGGEANMSVVNGTVTDNALSSTPSISSSSDSAALHSDEGKRGSHSGAVRHHQQHGRHRRMRHHPHYIALNCLNPQDELQAVGLRLHEQEQTCIRLQRALRAQQQQTHTILQHYWERHKQEVVDLQIVLQCTQEKLEQQGNICREQTTRLTRSDVLVKELYVENAHLLASIQNLEERCLVLLQQQASIHGDSCSSV